MLALKGRLLSKDLSDKVAIDRLARNVAEFDQMYAFHNEKFEVVSPKNPITAMRRLDNMQRQERIQTAREKHQYLFKWMVKLWPEPLTPEAIEEWRTAEYEAKTDLD